MLLAVIARLSAFCRCHSAGDLISPFAKKDRVIPATSASREFEIRFALERGFTEPSSKPSLNRRCRVEAEELVRADPDPGTVGVVGFHRARSLCRLRAEILFVNHPMLVDDERFHAGRAINSWKRHDREAAGHLAVDDVVARPAMRLRTLLRED
jgi:hypothetical protein